MHTPRLNQHAVSARQFIAVVYEQIVQRVTVVHQSTYWPTLMVVDGVELHRQDAVV